MTTMDNGNGSRRREDLTVDKTMRVTTTVGALVAMVAGVWFVGRWTDQIEDENILLRQEIHGVLDIVERTQRRQDTYIRRRDAQHDVIEATADDLHHALALIREAWAAQYGETLP